MHPHIAGHLGSASLVANDQGGVVGRQWYFPYGEVRWRAGTLPTDFTFTGQRLDAGTGLYLMGARWYDPRIGRWISADTVVPEPGEPQALNRYAYVTNNPLRYTDPSGHIPFDWILDLAGLAIDIGALYLEPSWENVGWLALDVVLWAVPYVPAVGGAVSKGGKAAKAAVEVASHADEAVDAGRVVAEVASHADEAADALRAGKEVAQEVVEVASRSGRPPIVIGENMAERVIPYAQQIGAQTINDFIPAERWSMEANEAWIRQMRAEGREIIDIGPHFRRRLDRALDGIRPDSEAYNMERRVLQGYEGYRKVFQRSGKYWGGVPGLDWR